MNTSDPQNPQQTPFRTSFDQAEPLARNILEFWFGPIADAKQGEEPSWVPAEAFQKRWFQPDPSFDASVKARFASFLETAVMGALDRWTKNDAGATALIILLDQFPRQIYRGSPKSFAFDKKALATSLALIHSERIYGLPSAWAYFCAMPTMHAEHIEIQDLSVATFTTLLEQAKPQEQAMLQSALRHAQHHRDTIAEFGRFPHRNDILERPSTTEERRYLNQQN